MRDAVNFYNMKITTMLQRFTYYRRWLLRKRNWKMDIHFLNLKDVLTTKWLLRNIYYKPLKRWHYKFTCWPSTTCCELCSSEYKINRTQPPCSISVTCRIGCQMTFISFYFYGRKWECHNSIYIPNYKTRVGPKRAEYLGCLFPIRTIHFESHLPTGKVDFLNSRSTMIFLGAEELRDESK